MSKGNHEAYSLNIMRFLLLIKKNCLYLKRFCFFHKLFFCLNTLSLTAKGIFFALFLKVY